MDSSFDFEDKLSSMESDARLASLSESATPDQVKGLSESLESAVELIAHLEQRIRALESKGS